MNSIILPDTNHGDTNYGDTPDKELFWGSPATARLFLASPQTAQQASSRIRADLERGLDMLNRAYYETHLRPTSGRLALRP